MTAILAVDLAPKLDLQVGDLAPTDIKAPRALTFTNPVLTAQAQQSARDAVEPQYDYTSERAIAISADQLAAFNREVAPLDSAFAAATTAAQRKTILQTAVPGLSDEARATLEALDPKRWGPIRAEASRVLDVTERTELRDTEVAQVKLNLTEQMAGGLSE